MEAFIASHNSTDPPGRYRGYLSLNIVKMTWTFSFLSWMGKCNHVTSWETNLVSFTTASCPQQRSAHPSFSVSVSSLWPLLASQSRHLFLFYFSGLLSSHSFSSISLSPISTATRVILKGKSDEEARRKVERWVCGPSGRWQGVCESF